MMRAMRAIVLGLLIAASGCAGIGPGQRVEPPEVRLADLEFVDAGLFEQRFRMILRVRNPNDFDLPIDGLRFALDVNDRPFATGLSNRSVTVPRLGEQTIAVDASTTLLDVVQQFMGLSGRETMSYRLAGTAFLRGTGTREVPFEQSGSFRLTPGSRSFAPTG